jgi:hypothetical protein
MKKIAYSLVACLAFAGSAFAGKEIKEFKQPVEPCFKDTELQIDVFGTYTDTEGGGYSDGLGGGVGVNYFFMRYLGVGVDGNIFDGDANGVWQANGKLIARFPIELGGLCLAPYVFATGGVQADGVTTGTYGAGGGLELRIVPEKLGVFAEGKYQWSASSNDSAQARVGVRLVF